MCGEERGKENNKNNNNNSTICKSMIHIVDERERERETREDYFRLFTLDDDTLDGRDTHGGRFVFGS